MAKLALSSVPKASTSDLPPVVWGDALRAKPELPAELIPGLLHEGAKMVLGGGSKSFKTWCLADLAMSLAAGCPWWGRGVNQGRVIYLNFEVQSGFFQERLRSIAEAKGIQIPSALGVWNLRGKCCDHRQLLPQIQDALKGEKIAAIFLDPLYKLMSGSENAQEEVAALMNSIERLGEATGAATIFGAHFAKGTASQKEAIDRISGSGVFARDPDAILTLTRHSLDDVFTVDAILRNCPPVDPFCVKWEFPLMQHFAADPADLKQPGAAKPAAKPVTAETVLSALIACGRPTRALPNGSDGLVEAIRRESGCSRDAAREAINRALGVTIQYRESVYGGREFIPKPPHAFRTT